MWLRHSNDKNIHDVDNRVCRWAMGIVWIPIACTVVIASHTVVLLVSVVINCFLNMKLTVSRLNSIVSKLNPTVSKIVSRTCGGFLASWWAMRDSNPQPGGYEPHALTVELMAPLIRRSVSYHKFRLTMLIQSRNPR